jgi:hypothetical protein
MKLSIPQKSRNFLTLNFLLSVNIIPGIGCLVMIMADKNSLNEAIVLALVNF